MRHLDFHNLVNTNIRKVNSNFLDWTGFGRNKLVKLLFQHRNIPRRTVRSLVAMQHILNTAHNVGVCCGASLSADCGYNPGWCRSHPHRLRNDLYCVEWDVKPYSTNHCIVSCTVFKLSVRLVNICFVSASVEFSNLNFAFDQQHISATVCIYFL